MPALTVGRKIEEAQKRLDAVLIAGQGLFSLDNVDIALGGDWLCQALERPMYEPRILGVSQTVKRRNMWTIFMWTIFGNGNNLKLLQDATRRSLLCRMDSGWERPEERRFKRDPFGRVIMDRGLYVAAALTVVRAYVAAGQPGKLPWFGAPFGEWSDLVRSALVWLGCEDPVLSQKSIRDADPRRQAKVQLLQAIANAYGYGLAAKRSAKETIDDANGGYIRAKGAKLDRPAVDPLAANLKAALVGVAGIGSDQIKTQWVGNSLSQSRDNIIDGLRLRALRV
jgi:putative DNA primase/helicase